MPKIRVEPGGAEIDVPSSGTLLATALDHGLPLPFGCQSAKCGLCRVYLLRGAASGLLPPSILERTTLVGLHSPRGVRLACQARLVGDVTVRPFHQPPGEEEPAGGADPAPVE